MTSHFSRRLQRIRLSSLIPIRNFPHLTTISITTNALIVNLSNFKTPLAIHSTRQRRSRTTSRRLTSFNKPTRHTRIRTRRSTRPRTTSPTNHRTTQTSIKTKNSRIRAKTRTTRTRLRHTRNDTLRAIRLTSGELARQRGIGEARAKPSNTRLSFPQRPAKLQTPHHTLVNPWRGGKGGRQKPAASSTQRSDEEAIYKNTHTKTCPEPTHTRARSGGLGQRDATLVECRIGRLDSAPAPPRADEIPGRDRRAFGFLRVRA